MKYLILFFISFSIGCTQHIPHPAKEQRAQRYVKEGIILMDEGKLDNAEAAFLLALEVEQIPEAYDGLGAVYFRRKDYEQAEKIYSSIIEWFPNYLHVYGNIALVYEATNRGEQAGKLYGYAAFTNPEDFRVLNNYGGYLINHKRNEEGIMTLRKARVLSSHPVLKENLNRTVGEQDDE